MALIHWWPLNGDTKDYGLNPVNLTNNNATIDNNGKIGKCYSFNGSSARISSPTQESISYPISISAWIYPTNVSSSNTQYIFSYNTGTGGTAGHAIGFGFYGSSTFEVWAGANCYSTGFTMANNTWYHVVVTVDKDKKLKAYVNGSIKLDHTISGNHPGSTWFTLGGRCDSSNGGIGGAAYLFQGKLNDCRVYDHILTPKEVKELSKALVLHYNFEDEEIEATTNLAGTPGNMSYWGTYTNMTTTTIDASTTPLPSGAIAKLSTFNVTSSGGNSFNSAGGIPVSASTTYTVSIYIKTNCPFHANHLYWRKYNSSGSQISEGGYASTANRVDLGDGWYRYWGVVTTDANTATVAFQSYFYPGSGSGYYVYYGAPQLEKKDHVTPWVNGTRSSNLVYDCSGYKNSGTPTGNPIIVKTTAIGSHACYFDGGETAIQTPDLASFTSEGTFTLIGWFMHTDSWSSDGYETLYGGPSGFEIEAKHSSTNSPAFSPHNWGGSGSVDYRYAYTLNQWHQWAMVRTSSGSSFYFDGVFRFNGSTAGTIPSGDYFIGAWKTYGQQNFKGYIGDFKIYTTALTATDIQKDYQSMAAIDKKYNLGTYIFNEATKTADYGFMANKGIIEKSWGGHFNAVTEASYYANYPQPNNNALGTYTQSNLSVTMTDNGVRIYSAPNLTTSSNGSTMWGGLCWSPMKTYKDCLRTGHRYRLEYHISGQSSRAFEGGKPYFTNMVGWGQSPDASPTTNSHRSQPANFQGEMDCYWDFTINDAVFKTTGDSPHSGFSANTSYLAYSSVKFGYTYESTGSLGTDIYITNIHLYDITSGVDYPLLNKNGVFNVRDLDETDYFSGYTPLEYIEATGTQWIDSGVEIAAKTNITSTIMWTDISGSYPMLYGAWSYFAFSSMPSGKLCIGSGGYSGNNPWSAGPTVSANTRYHIIHYPKKLKINDTEYTIPNAGESNTATSRHILLFGASASETNTPYNWSTYCKAKMYNLIIFNDTTMVRNFIPVKRNSDSAIGLFDTVNGRFYTNSGTGAFTAGPELDYNPFFKTYDCGRLMANSFNER